MVRIFHNPRCSKSRQTLQLIEAAGVAPEIVFYLDNPPSTSELKTLLTKLGFSSARDLMRRGEKEYKELGLKSEPSEELLIKAMADHPRLIERPIVVKGEQAVLGRPPENVRKLL